ncbi:MAG: LPS export ABC transporter periplasmic protein LptC [Ideonella sp.]|nr:LPS export ABC transporter periplasmic protein LptC [Ideonella sp.]
MNATATPAPELHLPDLPEVPVSLGPLGLGAVAQRHPVPWSARWRDALSSYLPLLLMALLATGTWWLVKHTPGIEGPSAIKPLRTDPDYTMRGFNLTRFAPDGRFAVRIEGDMLRHYPDTDRLEIDGVRIESVSPDGRITRASAKRALANGDVSEVQLLGEAKVVSQVSPTDTIELEGEFLHAFVRFERLRSHLPVVVRRAGSVTRAGGLDYDHLQSMLRLDGPVRIVLPAVQRKGK